MRTLVLALLLSAAAPLPASSAQAADACDRLAAKVIRVTGASLAGRGGSLAVFRAVDAERMSLDCRAPARIVIGSLEREPGPGFFALAGLAAAALTGADAADSQTLALILHQDSLLSGSPREGIAGRARLRCETGPRDDGLAGNLTVCAIAAARPAGRLRSLALSRGRRPG